jgi:histidine triad (HIT) family protein
MTAQPGCLFCRMASGAMDVPKLYDDERIFVIRDINPRAPVHLLVIPKQHVPTAADVGPEHSELLAAMFHAATAAAASEGLAERGYRLAFNVGNDAGMAIWHLHMHVLGGRPLGPEG